MANIKKKTFDAPDETINPGEKQKVEVLDFGDMKIQRVTAEPGWKWSKYIKPVVKTENCERHHLIYIISGSISAQMKGGNVEEFGVGDIVEIPPGHDGWTVGNKPAIWLELYQ